MALGLLHDVGFFAATFLIVVLMLGLSAIEPVAHRIAAAVLVATARLSPTILSRSTLVAPLPALRLERVPTKEETDKREMQERRLMLLNKERRAEALAELEAEDAQREREREVAERARRREAATGIYRCLLEMKQPVEAAEAARLRLDMCETNEERRQVKQETKKEKFLFCRDCCCCALQQYTTKLCNRRPMRRRLRFAESHVL